MSHNRPIAWPATGAAIGTAAVNFSVPNVNGTTATFNYVAGSTYNWTETVITDGGWSINPCPAGWRLPTQAEFQALHNAGSTWANANSGRGNRVAGRFYGPNHSTCTITGTSKADRTVGEGCIFLPASGVRYGGASVAYQGQAAHYSTSTSVSPVLSILPWVASGYSNVGSPYSKAYGFNLRCVK